MSNLPKPRKGAGANTGNPGHFASVAHTPSPTRLQRTQEQLVVLIEERLPDDVEICTAGDVQENWPLDSGDFEKASSLDVSDFAENLANTPGWETDIDTFAEAIPEDYLHCNRSFDAWSYGTMDPYDFVCVKDDPEFVASIHQQFVANNPHSTKDKS